jgi:hypothetical protein
MMVNALLVQELILSGNEIKQAGALAITECVADKENLKLLDLNGKKFMCNLLYRIIIKVFIQKCTEIGVTILTASPMLPIFSLEKWKNALGKIMNVLKRV